MSSFYESDAAVAQYLLFHYGTPEQICPLLPDARAACGFPHRCVSEPLRGLELSGRHRALDLGCAVGRGSFELARHFEEVIGIDFSERFIAAARQMQRDRTATVEAPREGVLMDTLRLELPAEIPVERARFETGDACALRSDLGSFDLVLMANLIDRLARPDACLARLPELVQAGGCAIITSPYTWLEDYTPREAWLQRGEQDTLETLRETLAPAFQLERVLDLPFLIREHRRKYQWSIAEASIWRRV